MTRAFFAFSSALSLGSIGAFFLFVPPLIIATVAVLLMGFVLMFWLGVQVGIRSMLHVDNVLSLVAADRDRGLPDVGKPHRQRGAAERDALG